MVISSETIDAVIRSQTAPRQQSGFGRIIITDKSSWLQTSGERIPIELPPNSNLSSGLTVRYEISGNVISITQEGAQKERVPLPPSAADIFNRPQDVASTAAAAPLRSGPVTIAASIPAGLYIFTSAEEAAAFIGEEGGDDLLRQLRSFIAENGTVTLRVETTAADTSRIMLLRMPEVVAALQTLQGSFTNAGLSSMPVDILKQILFDRGNLPFAPLIELDRALAAGGITLPMARAGSTDAQNRALVQWLHAALTNNKLPPVIAPLVPAAPASAMMSELAALLPSLSGATDLALPAPDKFGLTQQSIGGASSAADPIASAARRMGFTFEQTLAALSADTETIAPDRTLKGLLLRLSTLFPTLDGTTTEASKKPGSQPPPVGSIAGSATKSAIVQDARSSLLPARLTDLHSTLLETIARLTSQLDKPQPVPTADAQKQTPTPTSPQMQTAGFAPQEPATAILLKSIADRITETVAAFKEAPQRLPTQTDRPVQSAPPPEQKITAALSRLTDIADLLSRTVSDKSAQPAAAQLTPLVRSALDTLETLIRLLNPPAANGTAAAENPESDRARTAIGQPQERSTQPTPAMQQQNMLGKAVDTALDRLESLQLLARQTPTAQGTQQIIALPIKFDDHWTEINVRFLHHRQRKSSGNKQHYSVDIDVAPATLGAIRAHLDFRTPAQLQFSAEFERTATRDWFLAHREEFREALSRSGAALISMELRQVRKKASSSASAPRNGSGAIDMTG